MAILTSAFAYLGSYYAEANPSLQGQRLYTRGDAESLAIMDRQIYRLIGKATTLAALVASLQIARRRNLTPVSFLVWPTVFVRVAILLLLLTV